MLLHMLGYAAKAGQKMLSAVAACFTLILFLYSGYVLYDTFYLNSTAFTSWDLMQYKPGPKAEEAAGFQALMDINPDVVAWLEIEGTHINYPVLHGKDDLQYAYMDVYGHADMNGSIYLSSYNLPSFSENYIMIYGHNMASGGMFGDVPKYLDPEFFQKHRKGVLTTVNDAYELAFFACIQTNAYESMVYTVGHRDPESLSALEAYIHDHAEASDALEMMHSGPILALSTCSAAATYGRTVLFARLYEKHVGEGSKETEAPLKEEAPVTRKAVGHTINRARFALINLLSVLSIFYLLLPGRKCRGKYTLQRSGTGENAIGKRCRVIGILLEALVFAAATCYFIATENLRDPLTLVDKRTPVMLGLMSAAVTVDFLFFPVAERSGKKRTKDQSMKKMICLFLLLVFCTAIPNWAAAEEMPTGEEQNITDAAAFENESSAEVPLGSCAEIPDESISDPTPAETVVQNEEETSQTSGPDTPVSCSDESMPVPLQENTLQQDLLTPHDEEEGVTNLPETNTCDQTDADASRDVPQDKVPPDPTDDNEDTDNCHSEDSGSLSSNACDAVPECDISETESGDTNTEQGTVDKASETSDLFNENPDIIQSESYVEETPERETTHLLSKLLKSVSVTGIKVQGRDWYLDENETVVLEFVFQADEKLTFSPEFLEYQVPDGILPQKQSDGLFCGGFAESDAGRFPFTIDQGRRLMICTSEAIEQAASIVLRLQVSFKLQELSVISFGNGIQNTVHRILHAEQDKGNTRDAVGQEEETAHGEEQALTMEDTFTGPEVDETTAGLMQTDADFILISADSEDNADIPEQDEEKSEICMEAPGSVPAEGQVQPADLSQEWMEEDPVDDGEVRTSVYPIDQHEEEAYAPNADTASSGLSMAYLELFAEVEGDLDNVTIRISGMLPAGAKVKAKQISADIPGESVIAAYDIRIFDDHGNEYIPDEEPFHVCIVTPGLQTLFADTKREFHVFHLDSSMIEHIAIPCSFDGTQILFQMY